MDESATIVEHGLCNLGVMAHGEQIRGVSHQRIHVEYREGDAGQGSPQRSDHGYDTDDDCHGRKQGEDEQSQCLGGDNEKYRHSIE